ncbi:MAG: hypothetical protein GY793_05655 [Proteobacteria bacterium]|nr:hypothetical protein [Pseudomonadota bacterium]
MKQLPKEKFNTGFRVASNDKQGAMFGLDARVALAIFGALSVITGAALYNSIQDAKVVALITEFDNVDKAVTQYLLDTGSYPPPDTTSILYTNEGYLNIKELVISSEISWKGPYIEFAIDGSYTHLLDHSAYTDVRIFRKQDVVWDNPETTTETCLSGSASCYVYTCITGVPEDIVKALDFKIDGIVGDDSGNFRYWDNNKACKKGMVYDKSLSPASIP